MQDNHSLPVVAARVFAARAAVSAGAEPDWAALAAEIDALPGNRQRELEQLRSLQAVHRAISQSRRANGSRTQWLQPSRAVSAARQSGRA